MPVSSVRAVIVALSVVGASGARATEPPSNPDFRWSGFYVGGHVAHHEIKASGLFDGTGEPAGPFLLDRIGDEGLHGGVQAGYNWQWGRFVLGLEADVAKGGFGKSAPTVQDGTATEAGLLSYPVRGDLDYLATARIRAGLTVSSQGLLYVTAGAGFTRFEMDIADGRSRIALDASGLVFGAGAEIALSKDISLRAEWLHVDFDKGLTIADVAVSGVFDANDGDHVKLNQIDLMRIALNIKIGH
ncbi:MAG TPA: outer membrane beta-barrel protein [Aestuariivirgaceae bacterium]|nr:outer membrane beta-barrel protein [Aestuariivirgaceae bacterium]